jgi:hypothetical protein
MMVRGETQLLFLVVSAGSVGTSFVADPGIPCLVRV